MPTRTSSKSTKEFSMVAERRLNAMEDQMDVIEEAIINFDKYRTEIDGKLSDLQDEIKASVKDMLAINISQINASITAASKAQMNKVDGLIAEYEKKQTKADAQPKEWESSMNNIQAKVDSSIHKIQYQVNELEKNINDSLKNIQEHGVRADKQQNSDREYNLSLIHI